jgi:colanic acid/amylovoran biosynthesis glycosyltransferase
MRVAYILNLFPKISETFILNEILEVQRQGIDVEVFAFSKASEKIAHETVRKVQKITYLYPANKMTFILDHLHWFIKNPLRYFRTLFLAFNRSNGIRHLFLFHLHNVSLIAKYKPDYIHVHFAWIATDMAMLTSLLTGIEYTFITYRGDIFEFPPHNLLLKSALAKKHITISEFNKKFLVEQFGINPKLIQVIHSGTDFTSLPPKPSVKINKIITVARLEKMKALENLIKACRELRDRGIHFESLIIGEGPERTMLEELIKDFNLSGQVKLIGNQTSDSVFNFLAQSKIMVMTSRSEGIPVSLVEAMARRVPVIATRITGIPELVENESNGLLVEVDDIPGLVEAISKLLSNDQLCIQFCEKGYEKVFCDFNLSTETAKLINIWKN